MNDAPESLFARVSARRPLVTALIAVLLAVNAVLGGAIVILALRPRPIVAVPGVPAPTTIDPACVDPAQLEAFARLYVAHVDNYTPETVEAMTVRVARWIAPSAATSFDSEARRRIRRSADERIAHMAVLGDAHCAAVDRAQGAYEVVVDATLSRYFGDHLGRTTAARYHVFIRTGTSTESNPYGLWILGHRLEESENDLADR